MNIVDEKNFQFLKYKEGNINILFSTGNNLISYNRRTEDGIKNLENLKEIFPVKDVIYLSQIHSDIVYEYNKESIKKLEGDGIITTNKNVVIGVFNADCVPVIIIDAKNQVICAVHSGWKGTYKLIVSKAIEKMINIYNSNVEDIKVYIGPHNMKCCYEVSQELIEQFKLIPIYSHEIINNGRYLDLQRCIEIQLENLGVKKENINKTNTCTYCSKNIEFHSYRKDNTKNGRMFSFVYME